MRRRNGRRGAGTVPARCELRVDRLNKVRAQLEEDAAHRWLCHLISDLVGGVNVLKLDNVVVR